jgi:hypothetical protein
MAHARARGGLGELLAVVGRSVNTASSRAGCAMEEVGGALGDRDDRGLGVAGLARTGHDLGVQALQPGAPMTGAAMALVIGVSRACVGDLFGVGDYGDLTDEGVFHGGAEEEVGDVCARG